MKVRLTYTVDYDVDELMPEILAWADDHSVDFPMIQSFLIDRFISPELLDTSGPHSVNLRVVQ